jgi:hypothetical protein
MFQQLGRLPGPGYYIDQNDPASEFISPVCIYYDFSNKRWNLYAPTERTSYTIMCYDSTFTVWNVLDDRGETSSETYQTGQDDEVSTLAINYV